MLEANGHEVTAVRFTIEEGEVIHEKTNHIPIPLRSGYRSVYQY